MNLPFLAIQFAAGFVLLVGGAEFLVRGASRLAVRYNLPPVLIGLTIVAFGTSLPELVVSLTAALNGEDSAIAIGNIVGSNIANLGLILGIAGIITALPSRRQLHPPRAAHPLRRLGSLHGDGLAQLQYRSPRRCPAGGWFCDSQLAQLACSRQGTRSRRGK